MQEPSSFIENYPSPCLLLKGERIMELNVQARSSFDGEQYIGESFVQKFHLQATGLPDFLVQYQSGMLSDEELLHASVFDGKLFWEDKTFRFTVKPFQYQEDMMCFSVMLQELSKDELEKPKEERLSKWGEIINQFLYLIPESSLLLDRDMNVHFYNDMALQLLQLKAPKGQILQLSDCLEVNEDNNTFIQTIREAIEQNTEDCCELKFGNHFFEICFSVIPVTSLNEKFYGVTFRDISHRKKLEIELQKSESDLRILTENSPDVIMKFDRQYRHIYVNQAVSKFIDIKPEDFIGKTHSELGFPKHLVKLDQEVLQWVFDHGKTRRIEFMLPNERYIDWFLLPVFDEMGKVDFVYTTSRDLTELKEIESTLRLTQQRLEFALEIAQMAYYEFDFEREYFMMSLKAAQLIGISQDDYHPLITLDELLNRFIIEEDHQKLLQLYKDFSKLNDFHGEVEFRVIRNGQIRHLKTVFQVAFPERSKKVLEFGIIQDISEYKVKEQEFLAYQTKLQELVDTHTKALKITQERMSDAMILAKLGRWQLELGSDVVVCDEQVADMLGLAEEKQGGKFKIKVQRIWSMLTPRDLVTFRNMQRKALRTDPADFFEEFEIRVKLPDQDLKYFLITVRSKKETKYPYKRYFYGNFQDITWIRYTEANQRMFNSFVNSSAYWIGIADTAHRLIYLNKSGRKFFGLSEDEVIDKFLAVYDKDQPCVPLFTKEQLQEVDEKGVWEGESTLIEKDGKPVSVSQVVIPHKGLAGEIFCYSTIIIDLSAIKKIQEELLLEKNELDTFIYHASHDLKGPLASLKGLNSLVQEEFDDPYSIRYFRLYNKEVNRLYNILMSLIKLAGIKDMVPKKAPVFFEPLIENTLDSLSYLAGFEDIEFKKQIELDHTYFGDFNMLQMLLEQLLKNAISFRKTDGKPEVSIKVVDENNTLWMEISDNGQGMDKEIQERVFDLFYQGEESAKGPGLGLYLVWNIVEKLNGEIFLESKKSYGTKFLIKLPHPRS